MRKAQSRNADAAIRLLTSGRLAFSVANHKTLESIGLTQRDIWRATCN